MKKFFKWTGFVVAGIATLALLGIGWVYAASAIELGHEYAPATDPALTIPRDAADIAEGKRLALTVGCMHCHGEKFGGQVLHDFPNLVRFVAPNVSGVIKNYSDAQLEAVIRRGVKADGTSVLFMPSEMFHHLADDDVAKIIAYLRTVTEADGTSETTEIRPLGHFLIAKGDFKPAARSIVTMPAPVNRFDADDPVSHGKYLAMHLCTECHSQDLNGMVLAHSPPLSIAKSYSAEQFARLMRDGVAPGDRRLELMSPTAQKRFSHLTSDEVTAIYAFLQSRT